MDRIPFDEAFEHKGYTVLVKEVPDESGDWPDWLGKIVWQPISYSEYPCLSGNETRELGEYCYNPQSCRDHFHIKLEPFRAENQSYKDNLEFHKGDKAKARKAAHDAAIADRDRLLGLKDGSWWFVGVVVTVRDAQGREVGQSSVCGIESDAGDYFQEVARDCLSEAMPDTAPNWVGEALHVA